MRISDWSSDVCSSDLLPRNPALGPHLRRRGVHRRRGRGRVAGRVPRPVAEGDAGMTMTMSASAPGAGAGRSEEHTSELQSLMRISYAVFCLKKQKNRISNV